MWFAHFLLDYILILSALLYSVKTPYKSLRNKLYLFLVAVPLVAFSALRFPRAGSDTAIYLDVFSQLASGAVPGDFLFEFGFLWFTKTVTFLTSNEQVYLLIVNVLLIYVFWGFIRKYSMSVWLSVFLFIGMETFDQSMNLIRQILALSLILCSYPYLRIKSYGKFSLIVLLASTFHFTALVFFLAPFARRLSINQKTLTAYAASLCIFMLLSGQILFFVLSKLGIYAKYLESETFGIVDQPKIACLLHLLIDILIFVLWYIWGRKGSLSKDGVDDNSLMAKLILVGSVFWALSVNFSVIGRLAIFFDIFAIVLIPNVIFRIRLKKTRLILVSVVLLLFSAKYFIISYMRPEWFGIYPYKFYFEQ